MFTVGETETRKNFKQFITELVSQGESTIDMSKEATKERAE